MRAGSTPCTCQSLLRSLSAPRIDCVATSPWIDQAVALIHEAIGAARRLIGILYFPSRGNSLIVRSMMKSGEGITDSCHIHTSHVLRRVAPNSFITCYLLLSYL